MGKARQARKMRLANVARIRATDSRLETGGKSHDSEKLDHTPTEVKKKLKQKRQPEVREVTKANSSLFFQYNTNLRPPFHLLLDTNFINMSIQMKLDIFKASMDCLLSKCVPCITDCVMGELEKLGTKHRLALRLAKDPRFTRLTCMHKGTYADDCICERINQHRCYIVCTNDKDLKKRLRKVPGVPIMYVVRGKFKVERIPDQIDNVPMSSNKGKGGL
uniref:PIN domain-containing protein n=1 Tax=Alexandrium andersonii TaxID=327968 RepID=A0A7S2IDC9_9DINO